MHELTPVPRNVSAGSLKMGMVLVAPDHRAITIEKVTRNTHSLRVEGRDKYGALYKRAYPYDSVVQCLMVNP